MLLTQPIDRESGQMPSPEQLKRKIIIKVKELYFSLLIHKIQTLAIFFLNNVTTEKYLFCQKKYVYNLIQRYLNQRREKP